MHVSTERWGARGTLYRESVVIDGLNVSNWDSEAVFRDLAAGTVTAINATCATWEGFAATVDAIARWRRRLRERSDTIRPALSAEDIRRAKREGRTGIILGFQNASPIENDLDRLEVFAALGVRVIQLTFHERNLLGNGCYERHDDGVSNFGRDAIAEMNRLGIVIDLSHVGDRTTLETIEASAAPVAITHANCREYHRIPRNKTDQAIRAVAAKGGVIGATCYTKFLRTGEHSTVEDYVDAIDDLVERVGVDHVAFGTDFTQNQPPEFWRYIGAQQGTKYPSTFDDGSRDWSQVQLTPEGLSSPAQLPNLAAALSGRGYSDDDTRKVRGGNWLRLFEQVWQ